MCRPNPTDSVRPKADCKVRPLKGSRGLPDDQKIVALSKESKGMAEGPARNPDFFFVLFEHGAATVRAVMHHTMLKGVEV